MELTYAILGMCIDDGFGEDSVNRQACTLMTPSQQEQSERTEYRQ
jgi:hypothetical protein